MPKLTTINVTTDVREELEDIQKYLEETRGVNPSANDAVAHILAFWQQKREDKGKEIRDPEQSQNSTTEE